MFYPKLVFPTKEGRPFFYTNFVATLDGKVAVKKEALPAGRQDYWPIGSKEDYKVLVELRKAADVLIHGGNLAREFGEQTFKSLKKHQPNLAYYIVTNHPDQFAYLEGISIVSSDLKTLAKSLFDKGYKRVLVEGGPTLLGSFLKEGLMDEIFLTIAPKIFGNLPGKTLTLIEGVLFPADKIRYLKLISVKKIGDEIYLRYKIEN